MTNYEKLFGTPERATETMRDMCHNATACACCPLLAQDVEFCKTDCTESLAEWLESEVCDD